MEVPAMRLKTQLYEQDSQYPLSVETLPWRIRHQLFEQPEAGTFDEHVIDGDIIAEVVEVVGF